jgi:signal transduction histidine kinase/CHASE2 domain-containing sensor protein
MKTSPPPSPVIIPQAPVPRAPNRFLHWFNRLGKTRSLLPGFASALLTLGLMQIGTWQPLELVAYRLIFQLRGALPWDERVIVVAIDEPSLQPPAPFLRRERYAELVKQLTKAQVSTIALTIPLSEPNPSDDPKLVQALQEQARVVLATDESSSGALIPPAPALAQAMADQGHLAYRREDDGLVRSSDLLRDGVLSLAVATAKVYSLVNEQVIIPDLTQDLWINWIGPTSDAPTYSFKDVLEGKVDLTQLRDRIILVGYTAPANLDPLSTPFNPNGSTSNVYFHATVLNNLLNQTGLRRPSFPVVAIALLSLAMLLSWGMVRWRMRRRIVVLVLATLGWLGLSVLMLRLNYWIPVAPPLAMFGLTAASVLLSDRLRENLLLQQEVDRLWNHHYQDLIVRIANDIHLLPRREFATPDLPPPRQQIAQIASLADQFARSQSAQAAIARSLSIGVLAADWDGLVWFCNPVATHHLEIQVGDRLIDHLLPKWFTPEQWRTCLATLQQGSQSMPHEVQTIDLSFDVSLDVPLDVSLDVSSHPFLAHNTATPKTKNQKTERWFEIRLEPLMYRTETTILETDSMQSSEIIQNPKSKIQNPKSKIQNPKSKIQNPPTPQGILLILEDISSRKQVEDNLNRQMQELQRLNDLKDDFLNAVSHELRAPMANIKMAIHLLQLAKTDQQRDRYLNILTTECDRETHLITDLLNLQRLEAGAHPVEPEPIDLQTLLPKLMEPFSDRARNNDQQLVLELPETLPTLMCDRTMLERILVELLTNACKYTPPQGEISLVVAAIDQRIQFSVSNTGVDLPAAELTKIFEKFYRLPGSDRTKQGGTGLGLALVQRLVTQLGGTIEVQSEPGVVRFLVEIGERSKGEF